jgi:circadian clock protein KaiC
MTTRQLAIISTGIPGLDSMLGGGVRAGSAIVVKGAPGTGKTSLGVQFVYTGALRLNEPGLIVTFEELPQRLLADVSLFGWDLQALEAQNRLRVLGMSPETFLSQLEESGGLFDQLHLDINPRRALIDSISLLQAVTPQPVALRETVNRVVYGLKRLGVTAMLVKEGDSRPGFEEFIADVVIQLEIDETGQRWISVPKARGHEHTPSRRAFVIGREGITILESLSQIRLPPAGPLGSTGIPGLDEMLGGGLPYGSTWLLACDERVNFIPVVISILAAGLQQGEGICIMPPPRTSISDLIDLFRRYGQDLVQVQKRVAILDLYGRAVPRELHGAVTDLHALSRDETERVIKTLLTRAAESGRRWRFAYDFSGALDKLWPQTIKPLHTSVITQIHSMGGIGIIYANLRELDERMASFVQYSSAGIIEMRQDGDYAFAKVTKGPSGHTSETRVLQLLPEAPFVALV